MTSSQPAWRLELAEALAQRRHEQSLRQPQVVASGCDARVSIDGRDFLNFCSNDYLGLAAHPLLAEAATAGLARYGVGAGAAHLVCGHQALHEELEQALAAFTGREAALLFSSGFQANTCLLQTLARRGDHIFQDRLNHASLIDGARLSAAKLHRYHHLAYDELEQQLRQFAGARQIIASDSVFSMDGDVADAAKLASLAERHAAILMLDDAHGFGVLGERGGGIAEQAGLDETRLPVLMATLGKALGVYGAFVAGSRDLIDTLQNEGRGYIYTTAAPPALAAATLAALRLLDAEPERRQHLQALVAHFQRGLASLALPVPQHATPIQPLLLGDNDSALRLSEAMRQRQILVTAIRPPTVPLGTARLRVTFSAAHTLADVDRLLECLQASLRSTGLFDELAQRG